MTIDKALTQIIAGNDLSQEETRKVFDEIMSGDATAAQIAGILIGLRVKGEAVSEITGATIAMRKVSTKVKEMHVNAQVKQFQFSGHADRDSLFDMIKNIKGNPKVLTVHGDNNSCIKFAEEIHEKFGLDAIAPKIDDTISI